MVLKKGDEKLCRDHVTRLRGAVGYIKISESKWKWGVVQMVEFYSTIVFWSAERFRKDIILQN
jgi:hypothetical protein